MLGPWGSSVPPALLPGLEEQHGAGLGAAGKGEARGQPGTLRQVHVEAARRGCSRMEMRDSGLRLRLGQLGQGDPTGGEEAG